MIRVVLPAHLRTLAHVGGEVQLDVEGRATQRSVLDALEARYPMLRGTIRDHATQRRRPFVRFFACEEDLSHDRRTPRCPTRSPGERSPFWSWARLPAARAVQHSVAHSFSVRREGSVTSPKRQRRDRHVTKIPWLALRASDRGLCAMPKWSAGR